MLAVTAAFALPPPPDAPPRRVGWWASVGAGPELALHSALRNPVGEPRVSPALRLSGRVGLGAHHSVFLDLSGSAGLLSGEPYGGGIGGVGGRFAASRRTHLDAVLGFSVEGGADAGAVGTVGVGRTFGALVLDVRLRVPSAILARGNEFFGSSPCTGVCVKTGRYIPDFGTFGLSVEVGLLADHRTRDL